MNGTFNDSNNDVVQEPEITTELRPLPEPNPPFPFMDPDGDVLVSTKVFNIVEIVINVYLINGLSVIGSAGNIMSIIILYIHGFKNSTNIVLVSLAVADLLLVLTMPLRKISLIIRYFDIALATNVDNYIIRYHFLTLNRVWCLISNSHVAIISMERVLAVYFPFQVSRWVTVPRMIVVVLMTHAVWYVALTPLFTMFELKWIWNPKLNETIAIHTVTSFYRERDAFFNAYYSYFINISVGAFLLLFTLTCCVVIMVKLLRMRKKRKWLTGTRSSQSGLSEWQSGDNGVEKFVSTIQSSMNSHTPIEQRDSSQQTPSHNHHDMKALKMLMAVCITFLVLIFPTFFLPLFQAIFPKLRNPYWRHVNFIATSVSMLLVTLNASVNFVIYILLSSKFHRTFVNLCACKKREHKIKIRIEPLTSPT